MIKGKNSPSSPKQKQIKTAREQKKKDKMLKLLGDVEKYKVQISEGRDKLREAMEEIVTILEDTDQGLECIESGIASIRDGIETISQNV